MSFSGTILLTGLLFGLSLFHLHTVSSLFNKDRNHRSQKQFLNHPNVQYRHYICVQFIGRLGNQMFQYASAYGIGKAKGLTVRVGRTDRVSRYFNISAQQMSNVNYCGRAMQRFEKYHCAYDPRMLTISNYYNWIVGSYLQSWKYFINVSSELRKEFRFQNHISQKAEHIFYRAAKKTKFFQKGETYVGLHIRRGDMVALQRRNDSKNAGYNVAPRKYILGAMQYFLRQYHRVTFVICSDDMKWVKREFGPYSKLLNIMLIEKNHPVIDMAVLGLCDHMIMTTGTFSWWAAWLAGGTTVYYKHFIREDSILRQHFSEDFSDYYYPGWIAME